jgi:FixJ family two-component response regulator
MWPLKTNREPVRTPGTGPTLLAILPDASDRDAVTAFADTNNWRLHMVSAVDQALPRLSDASIPVILMDRDLPDQDWRLAIHKLISRAPSPCVILLSGVVDLYLFDEVVHHGGYDVLSKPLRDEQLRRTLGLAFNFWKSGMTRTPR